MATSGTWYTLRHMGDVPQHAELQKIEREFQRDVTITTARPKVVHFGLFVWLLVDVALVVFFFVTVVLYLVSGAFADQRLMATLDNNVAALHDAARARSADPLLVGDARVLTNDVGAYDVFAVVENPNTEWYATFTYQFGDDVMAAPVSATVMPGEEKYILALNVVRGNKPSGVSVLVEDVVWHRVDRHAVANTAEFLVDHSNFVVSEDVYDDSITINKTKVGDSTFTLTNNTPYSYYNPSFIVLLNHGGGVIAVNQVAVPQFLAGESRTVTVHWFGNAPGAGTVEVLPIINYFDEDEYAEPEGDVGTDIRDVERR